MYYNLFIITTVQVSKAMIKNIGIIILFCFLAACQATPQAGREVAIGEEFTLKPGESIVIKDETIKITFMELIEDSRCPTGVQCVWAGQARVALLVEKGSDTARFDISTSEDNNKKNFQKYEIILLRVDPYPESAGTPVSLINYSAALVVSYGTIQ